MRKLSVIVSAAVLALALAAPVAARAYTVKVAGQAGWTTTFIYVEGPTTLQISAKGFVQTAAVPAFLTHPANPGSGPAGQTWGDTCGVAALGDWYNLDEYGPCGVDDAYFGELIAKVGATTWAVGDATEIVVEAGVSGTLYLAVNDFLYTYSDNSGQFSVTFR